MHLPLSLEAKVCRAQTSSCHDINLEGLYEYEPNLASSL